MNKNIKIELNIKHTDTSTDILRVNQMFVLGNLLKEIKVKWWYGKIKI